MSRYELSPGTMYHDLNVEVGFAEPLDVSKTTLLLNMILNIMKGKVFQSLDVMFQGIAKLHLEEQSLFIQFRLVPTENVSAVDHDSRLRRRTHFIWYLFAMIDVYYPLGDVPFPQDFRTWINIAEEYDLEI